MKQFLGIEYSRGACATPTDGGPLMGPSHVKKLFPNAKWTIIENHPCDMDKCKADRFGDAYEVQQRIYTRTPTDSHIMIGGDHSVNFGHFSALADQIPDQELCLIYIDAHLDIHTPQTSQSEASGAPHGTNVRALLGEGDTRWLTLQSKRPALKSENLFYLGTRSYEPAEIQFAESNNIFIRRPAELLTHTQQERAVTEIKNKIGNRPYVVSFDFDAIDPKYFADVWVPEPNGINLKSAEFFVKSFAPNAYSFEFVEYAPNGNTDCDVIVKKLIQIVAEN